MSEAGGEEDTQRALHTKRESVVKPRRLKERIKIQGRRGGKGEQKAKKTSRLNS